MAEVEAWQLGVTIHFEGHLRDANALIDLTKRAKAYAQAAGWSTTPIDNHRARLTRVIDEEEVPYVGPTKGIEIQAHPDCDPIRLEFDSDLFLQEFTKTQFAGPDTHIAVIELLRDLAPFFRDLSVDDEGEFWDTYDRATLVAHIDRTEIALAEYVRENPNARRKVRLPDGRIADIMV